MATLFDPIQIGDLQLPNRIIMAPLTRCRASEGRVPNELMAEYYTQRATAGLILTEATSVTPMGVGYPDTPGIWSDAQVAGWRKITDAVHKAGGRIMLQLWHVGRISDPLYLNGELPVAPSAIQPAGHVSLVRPKKDFVTPRALETSEIAGIVEAYRKAVQSFYPTLANNPDYTAIINDRHYARLTAAIDDARTVGKRMGVTSRSQQRERRPTLDELDRLMEHYGAMQRKRADDPVWPA